MKVEDIKENKYYYYKETSNKGKAWEGVVKVDEKYANPSGNVNFYGYPKLEIDNSAGWVTSRFILIEKCFIKEVTPIDGKFSKETHPELCL